MRSIVLLAIVLSSICSCTTQKLILYSSAFIDRLNICTDYDPKVPVEIQTMLDHKLDDYILQYNSEDHPFTLSYCQDANVESLRFYVTDTKLVSSNQQTAGIVASVVGLSLPIIMAAANAPFYLWFYYFPRDISHVAISLSNDISEPSDFWIQQNLASPGFLKRMDIQIYKHTDKLVWLLNRTLLKLEKDYNKNTKQKVK